MALDWDELVMQRNVWVDYNFPDHDGTRTPLDSVLGVIEELGELTHAHLKQVQSIRGSKAEHVRNAQDAIGDLTVYLLGVMNHIKLSNFDPDTFEMADVDTGDADHILLALAVYVGTLADRLMTNPERMGPAMAYVVLQCRRYCRARDWDYEHIVKTTWASVKLRDWIKYPSTGLPPMEQNVVS